LQGKQREILKNQWKENRQFNLISIGTGNNTEKGNLLLRFVDINGELYLRVNIKPHRWIYLKVKRQISSKKDKWIDFISMLINAWQYEECFPYTVEIKIRNNEIYGYASFELPTPETKITKSSGVIGIDTNASPLHLAIAEVSNDGNLVSYQKISLHGFLPSTHKKAPPSIRCQMNFDIIIS
jgi:hypothetical protein